LIKHHEPEEPPNETFHRIVYAPGELCVLPSEEMKKSGPNSDPYLKKICKHWDAITGMYLTYEDHEPMIELDVVSGQIRAYPAKDYLEDLTDRTRDLAKKQYQKAIAEGALMVFVKDEAKRVLRSYVFPAA
jgi:hypothetical protein